MGHQCILVTCVVQFAKKLLQSTGVNTTVNQTRIEFSSRIMPQARRHVRGCFRAPREGVPVRAVVAHRVAGGDDRQVRVAAEGRRQGVQGRRQGEGGAQGESTPSSTAPLRTGTPLTRFLDDIVHKGIPGRRVAFTFLALGHPILFGQLIFFIRRKSDE